MITTIVGCLDDRLVPEVDFQVESATELLLYLESNGDYINSEAINEFVTASEVYSNRNSYLVIDVRSQSEFASGHIEGSANVEPKNLLSYLKGINQNNYAKIVLVSESGQAAAYYTALMRFAGFAKVTSMEYGMAEWHNDFASIWLNALQDYRPGYNHYTNEVYTKPNFSKLPQLNFMNKNAGINEKLEERINYLLNSGFNEAFVDTIDVSKHDSNNLDNDQASTRVETIYKHYNYLTNSFDEHFILCFGNNFLYRAHSLEGPFAGEGHLPTAVQYLPQIDLRSTAYLQTIPTGNVVAVYDVNGHTSAKVVAYLRLLGYDAKSILFGANNLFYSRLNFVNDLRAFAFNQSMIMSYPYITGN
ncbi:MAG: rhodanese-like domain-containing protein [Ignavibacteriaceae bacterium]|nr:rhodanese-like domain-containing protein [Ignavibacteriaceae bacterium]